MEACLNLGHQSIMPRSSWRARSGARVSGGGNRPARAGPPVDIPGVLSSKRVADVEQPRPGSNGATRRGGRGGNTWQQSPAMGQRAR